MTKNPSLEKQPWQTYLLYVTVGVAVVRRGAALLTLLQLMQAGGLAVFPDLMAWISLTMSSATAVLGLMCLWMAAARQQFALSFLRGYGIFLLAGLLYLVPANVLYAPFVLYCGWCGPLSKRLADPVVKEEEREELEKRKPVRKAAALLCGGLLAAALAAVWLVTGPGGGDPFLVQCLAVPMLIICLYLFIVYPRRTELNLVSVVLSVLSMLLNFSQMPVSSLSYLLVWVSGLMAAAFVVNTVWVTLLNHLDRKRNE